MTHLVIGGGEVGTALNNILKGQIHDPFKGKKAQGKFQMMHVCIPYSKTFVRDVKDYQKKFRPIYTVIHSSVPVGTSDKLKACHSPIRGIHPFLEKGIRTFVKFFGGKDALKMAKVFNELNIKTQTTKSARTTEAAKLWDTTQYGIFILLNKEIYRFCKRYKLDFDIVYNQFNDTYNQGYTELGMKHVVRPKLKYKDGKIGGHCVVQNSKLLTSDLAKLLHNK